MSYKEEFKDNPYFKECIYYEEKKCTLNNNECQFIDTNYKWRQYNCEEVLNIQRRNYQVQSSENRRSCMISQKEFWINFIAKDYAEEYNLKFSQSLEYVLKSPFVDWWDEIIKTKDESGYMAINYLLLLFRGNFKELLENRSHGLRLKYHTD